GDNQITVPAVTEICNEYPSTLIEGSNGTPAGGTYLWYIIQTIPALYVHGRCQQYKILPPEY
ncbi:MAG: hypothetical protein IPN10_00130, partial [Saprospiraceae bacterium]|nr:hypothetical protein [Saprospiraceae bacterium]